ncbi:hypothetical protein [Maritimibacter dapengensis]|uniref:N-acetyltransferase domain-containing protein n=1 Tax=Maritimibacter dapengensis TaxID=2836868 RepID=A0ABS6SXV7_9RHOB|nr:hypothetical protein [Maritimibacter dapengensis]MBV7377797.1 hypothetical protein [Maritimibacter dapengensis]
MSNLITVTPDTLEEHGFFCKMSARKSHAWQAKRDWLLARFSEGLELRLLGGKQRGFVEFMPAARCWRAIENADDLMAIHCLWVVGKSKGKGHARALMEEVERTAHVRGFKGVTVLASKGNWLAKPEVFAHFGYETVEEAAPGFSLMVKRFAPGPAPRLSGSWAAKAAACGPGLTVLRSAQCPYLEDAAEHVKTFAAAQVIPFKDVRLESAADIRTRAPSPYGVYALVRDGRLVAYHYLLPKDLAQVLAL